MLLLTPAPASLHRNSVIVAKESPEVLPPLTMDAAVAVFVNQYDARKKLDAMLSDQVLASISVSAKDADGALSDEVLTREDAQVLRALVHADCITLRHLAQRLVLSESAACRRLHRLESLQDSEGLPLVRRDGRHPIQLADGGQRIWEQILLRLRQVASHWLKDTTVADRLGHRALIGSLHSLLATRLHSSPPPRAGAEFSDPAMPGSLRPDNFDAEGFRHSLQDDPLENLLCLLDLGPLLDHFGRELAQEANLSLELVDILVMLALEFKHGFPLQDAPEDSQEGWMPFRTLNSCLLHGSDSLFSRSLKILANPDTKEKRGKLIDVSALESRGIQGRSKRARINAEGYRLTLKVWESYRKKTQLILSGIPFEWWESGNIIHSKMHMLSDFPSMVINESNLEELHPVAVMEIGSNKNRSRSHSKSKYEYDIQDLPDAASPAFSRRSGLSNAFSADDDFRRNLAEIWGSLKGKDPLDIHARPVRQDPESSHYAALRAWVAHSHAKDRPISDSMPRSTTETSNPANPPRDPLPYFSYDRNVKAFLNAYMDLGDGAAKEEIIPYLIERHNLDEKTFHEVLEILVKRRWVTIMEPIIWFVKPSPASGALAAQTPLEAANLHHQPQEHAACRPVSMSPYKSPDKVIMTLLDLLSEMGNVATQEELIGALTQVADIKGAELENYLNLLAARGWIRRSGAFTVSMVLPEDVASDGMPRVGPAPADIPEAAVPSAVRAAA